VDILSEVVSLDPFGSNGVGRSKSCCSLGKEFASLSLKSLWSAEVELLNVDGRAKLSRHA
jgi:hypothetical protein